MDDRTGNVVPCLASSLDLRLGTSVTTVTGFPFCVPHWFITNRLTNSPNATVDRSPHAAGSAVQD